MRLLPVLLSLVTYAYAAEPVELPLAIGTLKLRDGSTYENAKVVGQDAVGLKIMHDGGSARLPFAKLPKELAARFPRDAEAAKKQLEKEAKEATAHERTVDKAMAKQKAEDEVDEVEAKDTPWEKAPEAEGNNLAKIAALEAYIRRMENGIDKAKEDADKATRRAANYRATATRTYTTTDSQGQVYTETRQNNAKHHRADSLDRRARSLGAKIREAEILIQSARERIKRLEDPG
jgi:hypothetical protein